MMIAERLMKRIIRYKRFRRKGISRNLHSITTPPTTTITKSFAFSGCGWLNVFYLGVIEAMKREGWMNHNSLLAGTSGGSLGAVLAISDIDTKVSLEAIIEMSKNKKFKSNIDKGLKETLGEILPLDIHTKCNDRLFIVTTKVWPQLERKPFIISQFKDREHLLDTVSASCFIPFYSTPNKFFTTIQYHPNELYIDGGVFGWMPPIGDIRVSPFPKEILSLIGKRSPHISLQKNSFPTRKLITWILSPAPPNELRNLYQMGIEEAQIYIETHMNKK